MSHGRVGGDRTEKKCEKQCKATMSNRLYTQNVSESAWPMALGPALCCNPASGSSVS